MLYEGYHCNHGDEDDSSSSSSSKACINSLLLNSNTKPTLHIYLALTIRARAIRGLCGRRRGPWRGLLPRATAFSSLVASASPVAYCSLRVDVCVYARAPKGGVAWGALARVPVMW